MMPLLPGDPAPLVKSALIAFLGDDARVVRDVPNTFQPGDTPIVLVADDGGPLSWPVSSRNIVRVTVFGSGISSVRLLARRCAGQLHDNRPSGITHVFREGSSVIETRDPKTGADMASFTVAVRVRTVSEA